MMVVHWVVDLVDSRVVKTVHLARGKIADPQNWTVGVFARDALNDQVEPDDPSAVSWCARGALLHSMSTLGLPLSLLPDLWDLIDESAEKLGIGIGVSYINDELGHSAVLALFDHVLETCEPTVER